MEQATLLDRRSSAVALPSGFWNFLPSKRSVAFAGVGLLVWLFVFSRSMNRDFDLDEHQFTAPPALFLQNGALPYVDYPYFHMPNLIYLYAALTGWCPYKLLAARLVSAICGTATILLLFAFGWRLLNDLAPRPRWVIAGGLTLTFACSRLFTYANGWAWNHDTAVACTLTALLLHLRGLERARIGYFAAAGFLVGMATGIRLSFALAVVPLGLSVCLSRSVLTRQQRLACLAAAASATLLALLPAVAHLIATPAEFFFGNLEYARLNTEFYRGIKDPTPITVFAKLGYLFVVFVSDPGNFAILALSGYGAVRLASNSRAWHPRWRARFLVVLGLLPALWLGSLGPSPSQYQYHYQVLPFLVVAAMVAAAAECSDPLRRRRWVRLVLLGTIVTGLSGLPRWYWPIVRLTTPTAWTTVTLHQTGQWIRGQLPPGERVLTIDPLVALEGGLPVYPQYAVGRFIMHVGPYMNPEARQRHSIAWGEELDDLLQRQPPNAILCSRRLLHLVPQFLHYAEENHFTPSESPDGAYELWIRPRP